jgi:hypothetical protein
VSGVIRSAASKVMWVGRATVFLVGLAMVLAVVLGLASAALAGTGAGAAFNLGKINTVNRLSQLVGSTDKPMLRVTNHSAGTGATALTLQVQPGHAPMRANSSTQVAGLNADQVDGQDVSQIGVNGVQRVEAESDEDSVSSKQATARCPEGKVLVGTGFDIFGGKSGISPNQQTDVMMDFVIPGSSSVVAAAYEDEATSANWSVKAIAICATAETP